jgi:hypothetical protein
VHRASRPQDITDVSKVPFRTFNVSKGTFRTLRPSPPPDRRDTLVAVRDTGGLRFDVTLQSDRETVFITYPGRS